MPPWRTVHDTRPEGKPVSWTTMASASSAALRCCTSKSGGTYSASITGVSGSTLTKRIVPSDAAAIINAVATAGLAKSGSARSIGTRILLYMAPSLSLSWFSDILPRLRADRKPTQREGDRKSTRLNSSHTVISYAVFCLKKKKKKKKDSKDFSKDNYDVD